MQALCVNRALVRQPFGAEIEILPAPLHGEHTRAILEELNFDKHQIQKLVESGSAKTWSAG